MAFWTAVHEMGHAFNLMHAWDKEHRPWLPPKEFGSSLLSYMNYPYRFQDGFNQDANMVNFFKRFRFRFSNDEMMFLRHAPEPFVIMGGERFASNHAFEQANLSPVPQLELVLRANREKPVFEFMESVTLELKRTNISRNPVLVAEDALMEDEPTLVVTKPNGERRAFHPYTSACRQTQEKALAPGDAMYESLFISVDTGGWLIDDAGRYSVRVCMEMGEEHILSNELELRVLPPKSYDAEVAAQDYFCDGVGRVLSFDGSLFLSEANDVLRDVTERLPQSQCAVHATVALTMGGTRPFKTLEPWKDGNSRYRIRAVSPDSKDIELLSKIIGKSGDEAAKTLGHIDYKRYAERCLEAVMEDQGKAKAKKLQAEVVSTLQERKVLPSVVAQFESNATQVGAKSASKSKPNAKKK